MKKVAPGVYQHPNGHFVGRFYVQGREIKRKLFAIRLPEAKAEHKQVSQDLNLVARGRAERTPQVQTIGQLLEFYIAGDCPKAGAPEEKRTGRQLGDEQAKVRRLRAFFEDRPLDLKASILRQYKEFRLDQGSGTRAVDLELTTLSVAFKFAMLYDDKTGVEHNPMVTCRQTFHNTRLVKHAREFQPKNAAELHRIAEWFFIHDRPESHVLGWRVLVQALTGMRSHEPLPMRWDAQNENQPGYMHRNDGGLKLFIHRGKGGVFPYVDIHPALEECIEALRAWNEQYAHNSPWWFPGFRGPGPVTNSALHRKMPQMCRRLKLPKRTSHGLRSYFVNVLRSQGVSDHEIALRIGQQSGGKLIVAVYGEISPVKIDWEVDEPAWSCFELGERKIVSMT